MPQAVFEPAIPTTDRPQHRSLERAETAIGNMEFVLGAHSATC
jgi:hypothetical protein